MKKSTHHFLSNWWFYMKIWAKKFPTGIVAFLLIVPLNIIKIYEAIKIPQTIVKALEGSIPSDQVFIDILIACGLIIGIGIIVGVLSSYVHTLGARPMLYLYSSPVHEKMFSMSYEQLMTSTVQDKIMKIKNIILKGDGGPLHLYGLINSELLTALIGMIVFTGNILIIDVWLLIIIILTGVFHLLFGQYENRYAKKNMYLKSNDEKKETYMIQATENIKYAKDIRIYQMIPWVKCRFNQYHQNHMSYIKKESNVRMIGFWLKNLLIYGRNLFTYIYLARGLMRGSIAISEFVFLIGLVNQFSQWMDLLAEKSNELMRFNIHIDQFRDFLSLDVAITPHGNAKAKDVREQPAIDFQNVWFRYPESESWIFQEFSLHINPGENIGLVGINGAGKTTLMLLLIGLLKPTKGEILIDGIPQNEWSDEERFKIFSPIFQDLHVFPESIATNISGDITYDEHRLQQAMTDSGLKTSIERLEEKEHTNLVRTSQNKAIDLSGGQTQKMLLARALYKNGRILILDEPTAALDPLAESKIYEDYHRISQKKTSIFISHRLASSKFCDRLLLIEYGKIIEEGTHEQLMAQRGQYHHMYQTQSKYYQKGGNHAYQ